MAFIAPRTEGACTRGSRSLNAMHPECAVLLLIFISRGHDYHGNNREKEETSFEIVPQSRSLGAALERQQIFVLSRD